MKCLAVAVALVASVAAVHAQEPEKIGNGVVAPVLIHQVKPEYTAEARDARIQGTVTLDTVVKADGTVGDVTVAKSLDTKFGLDQQAVKAAKEWRFRPGTKDGKPVAVRVALEMRFTLK